MDESNDLTQLRRLLNAKSIWLKKSPEGANSLFRAVSASLYFTEKYHELIRALVLSYFNLQFKPRLVNDFQKKTMERYLENMFLFEFEPLNLDIVSKLFDAQIDLYFLENQDLKKDLYHSEGGLQLKLARVSEHRYSALFSLSQKESFLFAQNIVLSLVDSVFQRKHEFEFRNANNDKLINFDLLKWLSQSDLAQLPNQDPPLIDYKIYLLNSIRGSFPQEATDQVKENSKAVNKNVATEILSLFKKRKTSSSAIGATPGCSKRSILVSGLDTRAMFLNNNHCNARKIKSKSAVSKRKSLKSKKVDLFGDLNSQEIKEEVGVCCQVQPSDNDRATGDHDLNSFRNQPESEQRKSSTADDFSAFKDRVSTPFERIEEQIVRDWHKNDSAVHNRSQGRFRQSESSEKTPSHLESLLKNSGKAPGEDSKDQKTNKVSIKERLKKRNELLNGKLELARQFSNNDLVFGLPKPPIFADHKNSSSLSLETKHDSTQKLLSELKFTNFGKEKYSEIVDSQLYQGYIKFFDDKNGFGFFQIVKENALEDIFVYKSEFDKAGIKTDTFKHIKNGFIPTFSFQIAVYFVGPDRKKKAINIRQV